MVGGIAITASGANASARAAYSSISAVSRPCTPSTSAIFRPCTRLGEHLHAAQPLILRERRDAARTLRPDNALAPRPIDERHLALEILPVDLPVGRERGVENHERAAQRLAGRRDRVILEMRRDRSGGHRGEEFTAGGEERHEISNLQLKIYNDGRNGSTGPSYVREWSLRHFQL